ncbi:MAG: polymer-forming cytoskeletal protein [Armatimonadetes bacterium]|nr:polymer-forming cytoskeletal protein [Armatimonadota bacterium]
MTSFAVYSAVGVTLDSSTKINAGLVGSNGDVSIGPFSRFAGLKAGGRLGFSSTGGGVTVIGPITFNGDVALGQDFSVLGAINSGGSIGINDRPHITGDITAAGSVLIALSGGIVGNIRAGGNFRVGDFNTITGDVLANGSALVGGTVNGSVTCHDLSFQFPGQVNGKTRQGAGAVTPAKYVPEALPPADTFKTGKENSSGATTPDSPLPPGRYAALDAPDFRQVYLTAGDYSFQSITLGDSASLHLMNISATKGLHVFVSGDVHLGRFVKTFVKEQALVNANTALAKKALWEVLGKFDTLGSDEFFGTIFAPNGPIVLGGNCTLTGSLVSGGPITAGVFFTETFEPSGKFVNWPPPAPLSSPPVLPPATGMKTAPAAPRPGGAGATSPQH